MNTLTLNELITKLQFMRDVRGVPADTPVIACSNYGDRRQTMQALSIGEVQECAITDTAYSESGYKVITNDDDTSEYTHLCLNFPTDY